VAFHKLKNKVPATSLDESQGFLIRPSSSENHLSILLSIENPEDALGSILAVIEKLNRELLWIVLKIVLNPKESLNDSCQLCGIVCS
jgi:hypothetical protein